MGKRFTDEVEYSFMGKQLKVGSYHAPLGAYIRRDNFTSLSIGYLYASPNVISRKCTVDRIAVKVVNNVAGSHMRLGIYASDPDGVSPGRLIIDAGAIDSDTAGHKTVVSDQQLNPGLHWFAVIGSSTANLYFMDNSYDQGCIVLGLDGDGSDMYYNGTGIYKSSVGYGALPDPFPSGWGTTRDKAYQINYRLKSYDD